MPEIKRGTIVPLPVKEVWPFIADYNNWAPDMPGYEKHDTISDRESVWHITGHVGPINKTVPMRVLITEWQEESKVAFTIEAEGLPVTGKGSVDIKENGPQGTQMIFKLFIECSGFIGNLVNSQLVKMLPDMCDGFVRDLARDIMANNSELKVAASCQIQQEQLPGLDPNTSNQQESGSSVECSPAKDVWVLVEHERGELNNTTIEMLSEGRAVADRVEGQLIAVILGHDLPDMGADLAGYGADKIYYVNCPLLAEYTTEAYVKALEQLIKERAPYLVVLAATINGRDVAPRLAARLGVGTAADCTMVKMGNDGMLEATRSTYRDKVYKTISLKAGPPFIATIRQGAIGVSKPAAAPNPPSETVAVTLDNSTMRTKVLRTFKADPATVDISEAEVIVAGGRGMGSAQNWQLVEELAKVLDASVAGSRMALDEGWIPRERLIGQTGKSAGPRLYVGLGISGAKEHVLGLKEAKNIVAINKDPGAAIFKAAGKAVVGDVLEVVPVLIRKLKGRGVNQ